MLVLFALFLSYLSPHVSPDSFLWPIAFTGLIYPILLLINVLFLVYWTICFKKHAWANLIVILLGYGHIEKLIRIQENQSSIESELSTENSPILVLLKLERCAPEFTDKPKSYAKDLM